MASFIKLYEGVNDIQRAKMSAHIMQLVYSEIENFIDYIKENIDGPYSKSTTRNVISIRHSSDVDISIGCELALGGGSIIKNISLS